MKTRRRSFALLITLTVAVMLTTNSIAQNKLLAKAAKKRNDPTGTWLANVQVNQTSVNISAEGAYRFPQLAQRLSGSISQARASQPQSAATTLAPFVAVESFNSDGIWAENSIIDYFPPQGTPGRGVWERTGDGEFAVTQYGVIFGSVTDPEFQATFTVREKLKTDVTGDLYNGIFLAEVFDSSSGSLLFSFDGTLQGRRAAVLPLP